MKYLIIYASAGAGHKKAADAIYEALASRVDKKDIAIIDSLDYTNRFFKWSYSEKYLTLVNYLPSVWGFFYYVLDIWFLYKLIWPFRRMANAINCRRLEAFICNEKPDVIISAHFMANEVVSRLKKKCIVNCRLFSAVTDYRLHSFWVAPYIDGYFVATEKTREDLLRRGAGADKSHITGIPISPKFSAKLDKQKTQVKLGLDIGLFTVFIMGGGFGIGPVEELVKDISSLGLNVQFLIVCGYNKALKEKIDTFIAGSSIKAKAYGFVDNVYELMSASDILVTKSGGLTSAEAMAKGLPAIFVRPIPGQEKRNAKALYKIGAAFITNDIRGAGRKIKQLLEDRSLLDKMSVAARSVAMPDSAKEIVDIITCMPI